MKILSIISAFLLAAFGTFVVYWNLTATEHLEIYSGVISGLTLIFWSILLIVAQGKSYKGGAASIVGTMLLTMAIILLFNLCFFESFANVKQISSTLVCTIIFLIAGVALLKQGHKYHCMLNSSNPSFKRDWLPPAW